MRRARGNSYIGYAGCQKKDNCEVAGQNMNIDGERGTGTLRENGEKLILLYTNADCLTNKMAELNSLMQQPRLEPDIVVITEAKPKNARYRVNPSEFNIEGFYTFILDFNEEGSRGIVLYKAALTS